MSVHDFSVRTAEGDLRPLRGYAGRVLLIVNVASQCGLTPQYAELETLYRENKSHGLEVLGFPCNQFGGQEPGSDAEIKQFCSTSYPVSFPVFGKIEVNGPTADPLYRYLRTQAPGEFAPAHGVLFDHVARHANTRRVRALRSLYSFYRGLRLGNNRPRDASKTIPSPTIQPAPSGPGHPNPNGC